MAFGLHYATFYSANETGKGPVLSQGVVAIGGTATPSATVDPNGGNQPRSVRICVDTNCWVTWGLTPIAANDGSDGVPMGTDVSTVEYFDIPANHKISVIERV
jgi:hypothetical protein